MAFTLAEVVLLGLLADWLFRRFRIPGLVGMLLLGVIAGPYVLDHMARELMECEVMNAEHLKSILDQYKTSPQLSPGTRVAQADAAASSPAEPPEAAEPEAADGA